MNIYIAIACFGVLCWILTCAAMIDVARRDFGGIEKKALWAVVSFVPFIGFVLYFTVGRKKSVKKGTIAPENPE